MVGISHTATVSLELDDLFKLLMMERFGYVLFRKDGHYFRDNPDNPEEKVEVLLDPSQLDFLLILQSMRENINKSQSSKVEGTHEPEYEPGPPDPGTEPDPASRFTSGDRRVLSGPFRAWAGTT